MALPIPKRTWLFAFVVLVGSACGGDTTPTSTTGVTDATDSTRKSGDNPAAASAGVVTIGDQSWQFAPIQCAVHGAYAVAISGTAVSDPDILIRLHVAVRVVNGVLDGDDQVLIFYVDLDGDPWQVISWPALTDTIVVTVDGQDVTGTATVADETTGEQRTATFEFHCGK